MCGFVGYLAKQVPYDSRAFPDLAAWGRTIRHRGPDQAGEVRCGHLGLSTRRLSILDLSELGDQPMKGPRYLLGFNGEIYNHLELRKELVGAGYCFRSGSDTETVLYACEHWGIQGALERLNGMYALAVWDMQAQELTLARDPLGVKPLYFLSSPQGLYFASELKALAPYSDGAVSAEGVSLFLFFGFVPAPYSLLRGAQKVQAGEAIRFSAGETTRYRIVPQLWRMHQGGQPSSPASPEALREAVEGAVRRQLLADVPVGLFLSGGVDSSVIAAVAAKLHPGLSSFSIRPFDTRAEPGAPRDAEIAAQSARRLGLRHHEVDIAPSDFIANVQQLPFLMDEPSCEPYVLAEVLLSRAARAQGVPVVLTGHGADELVLGYPGYGAARRGRLYNRVPLLGPAARAASQWPWLPRHHSANLAGLATVWRQAPLERYATISAVHFSSEHTRNIFGLTDAYVENLVEGVIAQTEATLCELPRGRTITFLEQFARLDLRLKVPDHYNARLDKATMSASVEARVPFQDLELVAFVLGLSEANLLQGGLKGLLKQAFADDLPKEVLGRRKQTFQAPVLSWMRGPLANWARDRLASLPGRVSPALADPSSYASSEQAYIAWNLTALETWREALGLRY